jgi:23S rRNA (uracil1939-C5)-methyltransferase
VDCSTSNSTKNRTLLSHGSLELKSWVLGSEFKYSIDSFFQVNLPVYEEAIKDISSFLDVNANLIDMFSGVGSIGISALKCKMNNTPNKTQAKLTLIEIDKKSAKYALQNAKLAKLNNVLPINTNAYKVLDEITSESTLILDPPRAGLHKKLREKIQTTLPKKIIYLSCNPVTQARDIHDLESSYKITYNKGYNFFPRTTHVENLIILELRK